LKETDRFCDLVKYMEDYFPEVEGMILEDLGEQDSGYQAVCEQLCSMIRKYPFITAIIEGSGDIVLSAEEHQILKEFFKTDIEKEEIERKQLYFQGHVDGYAYLKKIKAVR
jgi:hypothetical protein